MGFLHCTLLLIVLKILLFGTGVVLPQGAPLGFLGHSLFPGVELMVRAVAVELVVDFAVLVYGVLLVQLPVLSRWYFIFFWISFLRSTLTRDSLISRFFLRISMFLFTEE
jgi:hypothetical protein